MVDDMTLRITFVIVQWSWCHDHYNVMRRDAYEYCTIVNYWRAGLFCRGVNLCHL